MKKLQYFQYAILWHPTDDQAKDGKKSIVISPPAYVLSKDHNSVLMLAAKAIPDKYDEELDQVEIAVRPF